MANDAYDNRQTDNAILRRLQAEDAVRERHIIEAADTLTHYFQKANEGVRLDVSDLHAELRTAIEHIVDAARSIPREQPALVKLQPGERDERD
jgi:hypothetical protein